MADCSPPQSSLEGAVSEPPPLKKQQAGPAAGSTKVEGGTTLGAGQGAMHARLAEGALPRQLCRRYHGRPKEVHPDPLGAHAPRNQGTARHAHLPPPLLMQGVFSFWEGDEASELAEEG